MAALAFILAAAALALCAFLFIVVGKLIDAMKLAGEALEQMALLLEKNIIR